MPIKVFVVPTGRTINEKGESSSYNCTAYECDEKGYVDSDSVVVAEFFVHNERQESPLAQAQAFEKNAQKLVAAKKAGKKPIA